MSLFVCDECGTIENTASSRYWLRDGGPRLCSACDPEIGRWHGLFARHHFDPRRDSVDKHGYVTMASRS